jgi:hypothetical protein
MTQEELDMLAKEFMPGILEDDIVDITKPEYVEIDFDEDKNAITKSILRDRTCNYCTWDKIKSYTKSQIKKHKCYVTDDPIKNNTCRNFQRAQGFYKDTPEYKEYEREERENNV